MFISTSFPPRCPLATTSEQSRRTRFMQIVHALPDSPATEALSADLSALGCTTFAVQGADELRDKCHEDQASVVILPEFLELESAWLVTAKLRRCHPEIRVIVLCESVTPKTVAFGQFVGASVLPMSAPTAVIARHLFGSRFDASSN